jgi:hypothetical protein
VADFGHAVPSWHCRWPKNWAYLRFQPEPSQNQACLQPAHQGSHCCWTISFHPYMVPISDVIMLGRLGVTDFGHAIMMLSWHCGWLAKKLGSRFQPQPSQNQGCLQPAQQLRQKYCCWTISFHPYMGPMSDVTML